MATVQQIAAQRDLWLAADPEDEALAEAVSTALLGCRRVVKQLEEGLRALGYPVQTFLRPSPAALGPKLAELETRTGIAIPRVVREFWRVVGGVSLVDLEHYQHDAFWSERGITGPHGFCDGFHVDACNADWLAYTLEDYESYAEEEDLPSFRYSLSPDGYHKDDISGGPPYAVGRNSVWRPTWENFSWPGYQRPQTAAPDPTDFLSYVRTALLECAGFPGLLGHPGFEPLRLSLVQGLETF